MRFRKNRMQKMDADQSCADRSQLYGYLRNRDRGSSLGTVPLTVKVNFQLQERKVGRAGLNAIRLASASWQEMRNLRARCRGL